MFGNMIEILQHRLVECQRRTPTVADEQFVLVVMVVVMVTTCRTDDDVTVRMVVGIVDTIGGR